jgi:hypothetical protein
MLALLQQRGPIDWRTRLDLLRGAVDAHAHPATRTGIPWPAASVAGLAWIAAGLIGGLQPAGPDWPGFLFETLPLGLIGAIAALMVVVAVARRSGMDPPVGTDLALGVALLGHVAWIAALAGAIIGGPYGAITGAAQSLAAIGTVSVGLVRWRVGDHLVADAMVIAGALLLVPTPLAWVVAGGAWLALAVSATRPQVRPSA